MNDSLQGRWLVLAAATYSVSFFQYALGYDFASRFPSRASESKSWIWVKRLIYASCIVLWFPRTLLNFLPALGPENAISFYYRNQEWLTRYLDVRYTYEGAFQLLSIVAISAVFARNYRQAQSAADLRRMKWFGYGVGAGLAPVGLFAIVLFFLSVVGQREFLLTETWNTLTRVVNLAIVIIPVSVGYAVIKHRVLGIELVIRRGLQYLLAKNVLRAALGLPILAVVVRVVANRNRTVTELVSQKAWPFYSFLIVTAGLSLKYSRQMMDWLDRKFFREVHDQEQVLLLLIEHIKELDSMDAVIEQVSREIQATLHPTRLYAFFRRHESDSLNLGYSLDDHLRGVSLPELFGLGNQLERYGRILEVSSIKAGELPEEEKKWLEQKQIELMIPIPGSANRLGGMLLLGAKKSEEPYTRSDFKLLQAISTQMGSRCENQWLRDRVTQEQKIRYEVLARVDHSQLNLLKECLACGLCFDGSEEQCAADGMELALTLPVERTIAGKYRLEKRLGKGGTSAVYEASDLGLSRKVAVKILLGNLFGSEAALRRFERGARASAMLNHPNIITVYDYGRLPGVDGAFLVMELLRGSTWRQELKKTGVFPPVLAAERLDQLLEGLKSAHRAGVVHRDLKPENVLLTAREGRESVKILDFGLAKVKLLESAGVDTLTESGIAMGTLGYMSPEQLAGGAIDERTDIFSVGVMTVEALTGVRPSSGRTAAELLPSLLNTGASLRVGSNDVVELDRALKRCLAVTPDGRFRSVSEMQETLIPAIRVCAPSWAAAVGDDVLTLSLEAPRDILPT